MGGRQVAAGLLGASVLALLLAPTGLPDDYSWTAHTLSEAAAQGVPGAWVARVGLALLGAGVLVLAGWADRWGPGGRVLHGLFGGCLVASAVLPTRSWVETAAFDPTLDTLHSIAATVMGFAFAFGVVTVAVAQRRRRALDVASVAASVLLPLGMMVVPELAGLLQRAMFGTAYLWFGSELVSRPPESPP